MSKCRCSRPIWNPLFSEIDNRRNFIVLPCRREKVSHTYIRVPTYIHTYIGKYPHACFPKGRLTSLASYTCIHRFICRRHGKLARTPVFIYSVAVYYIVLLLLVPFKLLFVSLDDIFISRQRYLILLKNYKDSILFNMMDLTGPCFSPLGFIKNFIHLAKLCHSFVHIN